MKSTLFHHEYTLLLSDNYHSRIDSIIANFFRVGGDGEEPIPDSGLINGNGRVDCNIYGKKYCNKGKLTKVVFQRGKKYLIRLINTSGFSSFRFSIDDHKLIVVEVDGIRIKPKVVKSLQINVAQRYGVIVKAYSKFRGPFAIRSVMQTECFASTLPNSTNPFIFASLRYGNTSNETVLETSVETNSVEFPHKIPSRLRYPKSEESINETVCDHLIEDQIVPMQLVPKELKSPDVTKTFEVNIGPDQKNISRGYINNITFVSPSYPPLFTLINGKPISYVPSSIHPIFIPLNNVVRFIINNKDDGEHPFHFHGHVCSILGRGKGIFDPVKDEKKLNKINPLRRDTFTLTGGGW